MTNDDLVKMCELLRGFVEYKVGLIDVFRIKKLRRKAKQAEWFLKRLTPNAPYQARFNPSSQDGCSASMVSKGLGGFSPCGGCSPESTSDYEACEGCHHRSVDESKTNLKCSDQEDDVLRNFVRQLQEAATEYLMVTRTRGNGEPSHYLTPANRSVEQVKAAENKLRDFLKNTPTLRPPDPPPNRIILVSGGVGICKICGSSLIRKPWLFGKVKCIQPLCRSHKLDWKQKK